MTDRFVRFVLVVAVLGSLVKPAVASDAPAGTMTIGVHVTLVNRWLDPADTEGLITPFMVLYALHDALVKPMPAGLNTPCLAESWTVSKDGLTYEFVLRRTRSSTTETPSPRRTSSSRSTATGAAGPSS